MGLIRINVNEIFFGGKEPIKKEPIKLSRFELLVCKIIRKF